MKPKLSVIIVSYNTREITRRCLLTLIAALDGLAHEIILVDNASADGSATMVRSEFPAVRVIDNLVNAGFGAANNTGVAAAAGDSLLMLNSDAFPEAEAIRLMLKALHADPRIGVVGPRLLNQDGSLQRSVYPYPSPGHVLLENLWLSRPLARLGVREDYERWPHEVKRDVPWLVGACLLVRSSVFAEVGGFDTRFFMYSEETDLQKRIRKAGHRIVLIPEARVTHLGGASGAGEKPKINRVFFESLDLYTAKHHGRGGLLVTRMAMAAGCFLRAVLWWLVGRVKRTRRPMASGKATFHWWLARRQLCNWKSPSAPEVPN